MRPFPHQAAYGWKLRSDSRINIYVNSNTTGPCYIGISRRRPLRGCGGHRDHCGAVRASRRNSAGGRICAVGSVGLRGAGGRSGAVRSVGRGGAVCASHHSSAGCLIGAVGSVGLRGAGGRSGAVRSVGRGGAVCALRRSSALNRSSAIRRLADRVGGANIGCALDCGGPLQCVLQTAVCWHQGPTVSRRGRLAWHDGEARLGHLARRIYARLAELERSNYARIRQSLGAFGPKLQGLRARLHELTEGQRLCLAAGNPPLRVGAARQADLAGLGHRQAMT